MNKIEMIVKTVDRKSHGLLESIAGEDGLTKDSLVRKVLDISHGRKVRTHRGGESSSTQKTIRQRKRP